MYVSGLKLCVRERYTVLWLPVHVLVVNAGTYPQPVRIRLIFRIKLLFLCMTKGLSRSFMVSLGHYAAGAFGSQYCLPRNISLYSGESSLPLLSSKIVVLGDFFKKMFCLLSFKSCGNEVVFSHSVS